MDIFIDSADLQESQKWLAQGSIRGAIDIQQAAIAGAHIITIPPQFLEKMADHKYTRDTVRGFLADARKDLERAQELRAQARI